MAPRRSITISGDLGSGKSTVAVELSRRLGMRRVGLGEVHRELARSRRMSALQLNLRSERDAAIDAHVDGIQRDLARSGEPLIVDSRLGWYFFTDAFKVHLTVDPEVGARRALARPSGTESYSSTEEAMRRLRERAESERVRFLVTYGVDKAHLRNYGLVCDTSSASPDEIADVIVEAYEATPVEEPVLFLDPTRVWPRRDEPGNGGADSSALRVDRVGSRFVVMAGKPRLRAALRRGDHLVEARLVDRVP